MIIHGAAPSPSTRRPRSPTVGSACSTAGCPRIIHSTQVDALRAWRKARVPHQLRAASCGSWIDGGRGRRYFARRTDISRHLSRGGWHIFLPGGRPHGKLVRYDDAHITPVYAEPARRALPRES